MKLYKQYWEENIAQWGELYLDISHGHEKFSGPVWYSSAYHASIGRLERKLMAQRYEITKAFIDQYVKPGTTFSDLGCGTGIFTVQALQKGAKVNAIDFSKSALEITQRNVLKYAPEGEILFQQADVQADELPESDISLAMGLTPYLTDLPAFMQHVLPKTKLLYCLFIDPSHWANRLRGLLPFLNVRGLRCHAKSQVDKLYAQHGWRLVQRRVFATGYIDLATKN